MMIKNTISDSGESYKLQESEGSQAGKLLYNRCINMNMQYGITQKDYGLWLTLSIRQSDPIKQK